MVEEKLIKVLVIEPDPAYSHEIKKLFSEAETEHKQRFDLEYIEELSLGLERLSKEGIDILLLDLSFPECPGLEALSRAYSKAKNTAIIVLLDKDKSSLAGGVLYNGAIDYLLKDELDSKVLVHSLNLSLKQHQLFSLLTQAKEKIEISEVQFRSVIEKYLDTIIILDMNRIVRFVNPLAESLYGCSQEELLGEVFNFPIVLDKIVEIQITRKSGKIAIAQMRVVKINWQDEDAYLVMLQDITERKHIDELKDKFVSTVSHELRTPLTIIKEGVALVLDETVGLKKEEQVKLLTTAKDNIDRLARLINDLLDISKLETGKVGLKRVLVDFSIILRDICAKWKTETDKKYQGLECCLSDLPIPIYIDPDKLTRILDNLISNAVKFTPEKGKISIELKDRKDQIEVSVSDTGIGIAREDLPRVFGRFQQFSRTPGGGYKGTGLGLSIVKELVDMHKGEINVESELNKGTRFTFTLPKIEMEEMVKEYINSELKEAADGNTPFSLVVIYILGFTELKEKLGSEKAHDLLKSIEKQVRDSLRRRADTILGKTGELIVLLPDARKKNADSIKKRIEEAIKAHLSKSKEKGLKDIHIRMGTATYPEEASDQQELLDKAREGLYREGKKW